MYCHAVTEHKRVKNQRGVTLVELVVSIVIISIALAGVLMVMNYTTGHSADPVVEYQAVAIAEAYLEEIELQSFLDPGGPAETGRADLDDVQDYHWKAPFGINGESPRDQNGNKLAALAGYSVTVSVTDAVNIGPAVSTVEAKRIDVTVVHPNNGSITLTGYRSAY